MCGIKPCHAFTIATTDTQFCTILHLSGHRSLGDIGRSARGGGGLRQMNFNENLVNGSDTSQGVHRGRPYDGKEPESYLRPKSSRKKEIPAATILDWLSPTAKGPNEKEQQRLQRLEREFIDKLIVAYERALEDGLPPNTAIASMLEWVSRECPRLLP
jgi:hypothetical protein